MKTRTSIRIVALLLLGLLAGPGIPAGAAPLKDTAALSGLKSAKAVFLIDSDNPRKVAHVLRLVGKTAKSMDRQGVRTQVVVVVIGPTVAFLTKDRRGISYRDMRPVAEIQKGVRTLAREGIRTDVCGVALHGRDIDPKDVIGAAHPVGNGFISAIGYQQKGYSLVPVY